MTPTGSEFADNGWLQFPQTPELADWAAKARAAARRVLRKLAPVDCAGTWFVGLEALDNDPDGRIGGSAALRPLLAERLADYGLTVPGLHRAQLSVVYPGYPQPKEGETDAAFRYRARRDAAHVDGILAIGPARRRQIREPHGFILGLPLTEADPDAAPLVAWQGSHHIIRAALATALAGIPETDWGQSDVTDAYTAARRQIFETCPRVPLSARPGQMILLHRLTLHGIAPFASTARADPDGRMIAYFRPMMPGGVPAWIRER